MKLNILGQEITVSRKKLENNLAGRYDPNASTIEICESLSAQDAVHTLLHEIVHAALHRGGISQTSIHHDLHEIICEVVATAIAENFKLKVEGVTDVKAAKGKAKTHKRRG